MGGARIVILGASFAGLETARTLWRLLGGRARVSVIDRRDTFVFRPSLPWIVFGERQPEEICVPLRPLFEAYGAEFLQDHVEGIEPDRNRVCGRKGWYSYDFLVIALGGSSPPKAPFAAEPVDGGRWHSSLWLEEAMRLRQAVAGFRGGDVVVALHPHSPLLCPAYELVFQADAFWRRRGMRERCRLTFITYEDDPYTLAGTAGTRVARRWLAEAGIRYFTGTFIREVHPRSVVLGDGYELPAALVIVLPAYQGSGFLRQVPYLTDAEGFVVVDPSMRSRAHVTIFAAGDCVALPGPKTGLIAELQGRVAATNIAADLGLAAPVQYRSLLACLVDLGPGRGLLCVREPAPQQGRVETRLFLAGRLPRWGKHAFERYFMRRWLQVPAGAAERP